jgi:uncharacterized protein (TIGR00725 family)
VAVVGGYYADAESIELSEELGRLLAGLGAVVVTGGRQGVAEAVSRGATRAGGLTVGILPGRERDEANEWVQVAVPTGLGETRNALVVMGADAVVALPGQYGTLSEVAFALLAATPVVALGGWELPAGMAVVESRVERVATAADAVAAVERVLKRSD